MGVREYLKVSLWEYVLVLVAAASLSCTVVAGFDASGASTATVAVAVGVCAVVLALLYVVAYNKRTALFGGIALAVALAAFLVGAIALSGGANVFADSEDNAFLAPAIDVLVALVSFLLTRKRWGTIAFSVAGCVIAGAIEFLYWEFHVVAALLFVGACIALLVYGTYRHTLKGTASKHASFSSVSAVAVIAAVATAALAAGIFVVFIEPLNPPKQEVKLITEYLALEEQPRRGTSEELARTNPDLSSVISNDQQEDLEQDENQEEESEADQKDGTQENPLQAAWGSISEAIGLGDDGQSVLDLITHNTPWWGWILIVLVIIVLVATPILIKLALRRRFYNQVRMLDNRSEVERLYLFFVRNFERMGIKRSPQATPYEYAIAHERDFSQFCSAGEPARNSKDDGAGAMDGAGTESGGNAENFLHLTYVFVKACFGAEPISDKEVRAYERFYESFYKNCRKYAGRLRYLRLFFRL